MSDRTELEGDKDFPLNDVERARWFMHHILPHEAADRMVEERFLHPEQRNDLWHGDDLDAMVAWMRAYTPAQADKWMDEKRRKSLR